MYRCVGGCTEEVFGHANAVVFEVVALCFGAYWVCVKIAP